MSKSGWFSNKTQIAKLSLKSTAYWYTDFVGNGRSRELLSAISRAVKFTRINTVKTPLTAQNFSLEKVILSQPNVPFHWLTNKVTMHKPNYCTTLCLQDFSKPTACKHPNEIYLLLWSRRMARSGEDLSTVKIMQLTNLPNPSLLKGNFIIKLTLDDIFICLYI